MARPSIDGFSAALPLYVLGAIFLVPLTIGVVLVSNSADQDGRAKQISRDLVSMYAQGLDLSRIENRNLAMRVAQGLGLDGSRGVVILTKSMAYEYIERGVRINAVAPGGIETPIINDFAFPEGASARLFTKIMSPMGAAEAPVASAAQATGNGQTAAVIAAMWPPML